MSDINLDPEFYGQGGPMSDLLLPMNNPIPLQLAWLTWIPTNLQNTHSRVEDRDHSVQDAEMERSSAEESKRIQRDPGAKEGQTL